jgi:hypothetical protein
MAKRGFLAALTVVLFSYPARAAVTGSVPFKTYRNDAYGFEFRYSRDMQVYAKSNDDIKENLSQWGGAEIVTIVSGWLQANASISRSPTEASCFSKFRPHPIRPEEISATPKLNGFFVDEPINDMTMTGHAITYQAYMKFVQGKCFTIRGSFPTSTDPDTGTSARNDKLIEIVKSFRFLDNRPKDKP